MLIQRLALRPALCYALHIGEAIYVVHAFQKKSKSGIATPKAEIDLVTERIKRLKEELKR